MDRKKRDTEFVISPSLVVSKVKRLFSGVSMRCPTINDLPSPLPGKVGWPWTVESSQLPDSMLDGQPWPRISIVTPSYNQGRFIEETIRSALLQGYPNLEYIIMDGGSTDNSVEIIKKYEPWLAYWVSEKDRGQAHAINKGWHWARGEILAWLNSDDRYLPGALHAVATTYAQGGKPGMVFGDCQVVDEAGRPIRVQATGDFNRSTTLMGSMPQPSVFLTRELVNKIGLLDESLHFVLDVDLFLRAWASGQGAGFQHCGAILACSREYVETKTASGGERRIEELRRVMDKLMSNADTPIDMRKAAQKAYNQYFLWQFIDRYRSDGTNKLAKVMFGVLASRFVMRMALRLSSSRLVGWLFENTLRAHSKQ